MFIPTEGFSNSVKLDKLLRDNFMLRSETFVRPKSQKNNATQNSPRTLYLWSQRRG